MDRQVFVTGYGGITAAGHTIEDTWQNIKQGKSGIKKITHWDSKHWEHSLAGEITPYEPKQLFPERKMLKLINRQDVFGLNAVIQAVEHSELINHRDTLNTSDNFNEKTGIFVGSPGNKFSRQDDFLPLLTESAGDMPKFGEALGEHIHPMWLLKTLPNNVLAYAGIKYGFKGANQNIVNHAVSGTQAILEAYHFIKSGVIDRAIVVSYDVGHEAQELMYYQGMGLLSKTGIRSFDAHRDGTVLGEGAGALVLESLESVKSRNAECYGEILGGHTTSEADGVLSQRQDGDGLKRAIKLSLSKTGLNPSDIGMITAHANSTHLSDKTEALALSEQFGDYSTPVTGFKWSIGHTLTAAGTIESILTLLTLRDGTVNGIPSLVEKDSDCEKINVDASHKPTQSNIGLVTSRAFGSLNTCLLLKA